MCAEFLTNMQSKQTNTFAMKRLKFIFLKKYLRVINNLIN